MPNLDINDAQPQDNAVPELLFNPIQITPKEGETQEMALERLTMDGMKSFEMRRRWRQPYESLWNSIYQLYMTRWTDSRIPTRAKVVMPKVFQAIESAVPKLVSIIFGKSPWFEVASKWPLRPIPSEVINNLQALLSHQLELAGFFEKFIVFTKQLLMYGTSYLTVTWKVRREWVTERIPNRTPRTIFGIELPSLDIQWETRRVLKVVERRPEITVLPIEAVYPSPDQTEVQDGDGIYWLDSISMDDLEELSRGRTPVYGNFDKVKELSTSGVKGGASSTNPANNVTQVKASTRGVNDPTVPGVSDPSKVNLIHFWGKRDLDGDGQREEVHMVFANQNVLIRAVPNPYEHQKRCLILARLFPLVNEWYGMGFVEPAISSIAAINTLYNQNLDMNNLIINRMWKVDPTLDVDIETLRATPNGIALASPLTAVQELDQSPLPFSPVQMIQALEQELESTMTPKSIQGTPESGALGRTARGAQLIVNQALEKFGTAATLLEQKVLHEMLLQMHQLNGQYLDQDEYLLDIYENIFPIKPTPEQIRADVAFKFLGVSETITKEATMNQLVAFENTWLSLMAQTGTPLQPLMKTHWDLMGMKQPFSEIFPEGAAPAPLPIEAESASGGEALSEQAQQNGVGGGIQLPPLDPLQPE